MFAALGDPVNFPQSVRGGQSQQFKQVNILPQIYYSSCWSLGRIRDFDRPFSGPPACLCSTVEQCQMDVDVEVDVVANVTQV